MSSPPNIVGAMARITDHAGRGVARLLDRYRGLPKTEAVARALLNQAQGLEDALWDLLTKRWVTTAEGLQLDVVGYIVGEARQGRADAAYRPAIQARVLINRSASRPEDLIAILRVLVGDDDTTLEERWASGPLVLVDRSEPSDGIQPSPYVLVALLREAKTSAVPLQHIYAAVPAAASFTLSTSSAEEPSADLGFADGEGASVGGSLSGVV